MPAPPHLEADRREETFTAVFDRHFHDVHSYVARRLGRDVADDVAADTFLTAFRLDDRFDAAKGDRLAWLYGIATNLMRRHRRDMQLGPVKDPLGRKGNGVELSQQKGELALKIELVLDPANGTLLSVRYITNVSIKNYYVAVLDSGWTDKKPTVPSPDVP